MPVNMFCVFDAAADRFLHPFNSPSIDTAIREFKRAVTTPDHQFNRFPDDYSLFHIGQFNDETGHLEPEAPRSIATARQLYDTPSLVSEE